MLKSLRSRASKKVRSHQLSKSSRRPRLELLEGRAMMACDGFTTFTQGGWGADPNGDNPGSYLHGNFAEAFPNGVQIGSQTAGAASDSVTTAGNQAAMFTSAQAITDWLPHGGPSGALGGDTVNPLLGSAPDDGTLAGQTLALSLNVGFDLYDANFSVSTTHLKDLEVTSGPFAGQTVQFVLNTANAILSGITNTGYSADDVNAAATAINQNFDNGTVDLGYLDGDCDEEGPLFVSLSGRKFEDLNGNGVDDTDPGIAGWQIAVWLDSNANGTPEAEETQVVKTDPNGDWTYANEVPHTDHPVAWTVFEVNQAGWTQTYGNNGYNGTFTTDDRFEAGIDFGNFKNFNLSGTKFEDHNGDGLTVGDSGLGGITIFIDVNGDTISNDGAANTTTTAADGTWSFNGLGVGYAGKNVLEVLPSGYTQTLGIGGYAITGTSGADQTGLNFANFKNINISGTKYQDHNGNGVKDAGDGALGNFTFILNDNGDGIVNNGEKFAVSAADGTWSITNVGPGAWTVTEAYAGANWVQTQGETGYNGTASSGVNAIDLIFGNTDVGVENGKTIGFWSNKNGQALINSGDIAALNGYNLKTATGADAVFTTAASVKSFLLGATATNMANMLSAQLAGTILNFRHGFFGSSTSIYVDGSLSTWGSNSQGVNLATNLDNDGDANNSDSDGLVNQFGFVDINGLIAAANAELAAHSNTTSGSTFDAFRKYQEALKIAFDGMNNNLAIFAQ